ncbi:PucR family transcriptional regulator [Kocuria sp. CPCC 205261]|uniref:PucR family transcriptional regulator n=1 Tax=Kocuria sp. CPCC 205261 TaxID=3073554 RepID=UPI0034D5A2DF
MRTDSADSSTFRTIRPPAAGLHMPTVREVIESPEVMAGRPEVLAGYDRLDRPVRWVHVMDGPTVEGMLSGQELVLSTGVGWPGEDELPDYVTALVKAGTAGLVLELGSRYRTVPAELTYACRKRGLLLIALHQRVRFVSITEAVHRRILAAQMEALEARDDIHALFTELVRVGAPADHIVHEVARLLRGPVVLEDLSHRVVTYSPFDEDVSSLLADWRNRSRIAHERGNPARSVTFVEARGKRWGYLIAIQERGHSGGDDFVLSQAAVALSLDRATSHGTDEWLRLSHQQLLDDVVARRLSGLDALAHRLTATGMTLHGRHLIGVSMRPRRSRTGSITPLDAVRGRSAVLTAAATIGADAICSQVDLGMPMLLAALSVPRRHSDPDADVDRLAAHVAAELETDLELTAGSVAHDVPGLLSSLDESIELLHLTTADSRRPAAGTVVRATGQELPLLLSRLRDDPRVQEYAERVLGPLLAYDARRGTDLVQVLTAYLENPGNRTRAASNSHLSRSVFYQRIAIIEKLLNRSLDDGHTIASLYSAALAYRQMGASGHANLPVGGHVSPC